MEMKTFQFNDGGRSDAGYKGKGSDCVCRAICIATGLPYEEVYDYLAKMNASQRKSKYHKKKGSHTAREGISTTRKWFKDYMRSLGFVWVPTMKIGQGCKVHLKAEELPMGTIICNVSKHMVAVIDGVIHDTHDCSREGTRCVYGYWVRNGGG